MVNLVQTTASLYSTNKDIQEICYPLQKLGITFFSYKKTYNDNSQISLGNSPEWLKYFYDKGFHSIGTYEKHPSYYHSCCEFWSHLNCQKIFEDARTYFNIDHGITIIEKHKTNCEFFYFGTIKDNPAIMNFYMNHLDLLKRFTLYFKDKANLIIKKTDENRIILPTVSKESALIDNSKIITTDLIRQAFLKETSINKLRLTGELENEFITHKQFLCIVSLIEGKTSKEIAKSLGLSHRTIEGHIAKLKIRFNCQSKAALIKKLLDNGLQNALRDKRSAM